MVGRKSIPHLISEPQILDSRLTLATNTFVSFVRHLLVTNKEKSTHQLKECLSSNFKENLSSCPTLSCKCENQVKRNSITLQSNHFKP